MKIPFTLDAWLKDKSQKVVDKDGRPVRIICTDADGLYPIIGLVDNKIPLPCGKDGRPPYIGGGGGTLFIVTPEEELSEWQRFISACLQKHGLLDCGAADRIAKESATELLSLVREQFIKDGYVIEKKAFHDAVEKVDPEVMKAVLENVDNANEELTEFEKGCIRLYQDGRDDGFAGDNLSDENLKECSAELLALARKELIKEGTSKNEMGTMLYDAGFEDGKAEALKDLPRWNESRGVYGEGWINDGFLYYKNHSIQLSSLEKLPGFKED